MFESSNKEKIPDPAGAVCVIGFEPRAGADFYEFLAKVVLVAIKWKFYDLKLQWSDLASQNSFHFSPKHLRHLRQI